MTFTPKQILMRFLLSVLAGFLVAVLIGEGTHLLLKEPQDRAPERIELVIPAGTAAVIAAGQKQGSIPENMIFVQGDTLVVRNEDSVDHQLGPVWVPAGSSGSLVLDQPNNLSYACSFQPSRYLGLDVRPPVTWKTRLQGIVMIALPTIALFGVYSFVLFPARNRIEDMETES